MKKLKSKIAVGLKAFPLCALGLAINAQVSAQEEDTSSSGDVSVEAIKIGSPIEEVMVMGRLQSGAQQLALERMESENVVDLLGADQISRIGDSTVASALRRAPGITLVNGKFVYVRGLGERNTSTTLNSASVPSPDLTRSVLPLDIFPANVVDSIAIQKTFSANMPAQFGGGNVNIRTKGAPEEFVFVFELSTGANSESDRVLSYNGGSDDDYGTDDGTRALSSSIESALRTYRLSVDSPEGDLSAAAIQATLDRAGVTITDAEAEAMNAALASQVYRDLDISEDDESLNDFGGSVTLGNRFELSDMWSAGVLFDLSYDKSNRTDQRILRRFDDPEDEFSDQVQTTTNVSITGVLNFGLGWGDDHEIDSKNLFLRNTDDEVSIANIYNQTIPFSSGQGFRSYDYKFEERELEVYQFQGSHRLGYDTKEALGLGDSFLDGLTLEWFYSDAEVVTDIPSETSIQGFITRDVASNEITSSRLLRGNRMFDVRYTDLKDEVESSGFELSLPIEAGDFVFELSGGGKYDTKARRYEQLDLSIGTTSSAVDDTLGLDISAALSDENILDPENGYQLIYQSGLSRSYLAATTTDAFYGDIDVFWKDTIRLVVGARYEEYKQFSAPWQPYRVIGSQVRIDVSDANESEFPDGTYYQDDVYPSAALTYIIPGFLAEDFQVRFGVSETVVRPDLREVSDSSFQDPLDDSLIVQGNPDVVPTTLTNIDLRSEWLFSNGDNLAISLFYKDMENVIEYFEAPGAENSRSATIENAESGFVQGMELEWTKSLAFMGDFASQFYFAGNLTLAETEIEAGDEITVAATNRVRPMQGASEYVINFQLGYDSHEGHHSATLVFNESGERVLAGGITGEPDSYEQPFSAVDFSYFYYPTESLTVKFTAKNLLDEDIEVTKGDVTILENTVGTSYGLSLRYVY